MTKEREGEERDLLKNYILVIVAFVAAAWARFHRRIDYARTPRPDWGKILTRAEAAETADQVGARTHHLRGQDGGLQPRGA